MTEPTFPRPAPVQFHERDAAGGRRVGLVTLNRPGQINALDLEMCRLMLDRLREWASDESIACVVIEGAGEKGFCAGGDVAEVVRQVRAGGPRRFVYGDAFFDTEYRLDRLIHAYPKPVVSWAHGVTMGGGVGLAVGASHRIVSPGLRLAMPEIHIGLFPDVGGGWFLNRVPDGAGLLMALTGLALDETDALHVGLADWLLPAPMRARTWQALAELHWEGQARRDHAAVTNLLAGLAAECRTDGQVSRSALRERAEAIRAVTRQPDVIALRDALRQAARIDAWFEPLAASLSGGSPTAAHVTFEYMRRARRLSLDETLRLDGVLARAFQRGHDFPEGVRALLIDKDRSPRWSPERFEDVRDEAVAAHFAPTG